MLRRLLARRLGLWWHGGAETARDRCGGSGCLRSRDGERAMLLDLAVLEIWVRLGEDVSSAASAG
jgi:hypothetical protein